jgi:uncharacterized protein (UPF0332 family)
VPERWIEIAKSNLNAAERLFQSGESPRSVVSRSYYAGFSLVIHVAVEHHKGRLTFSDGRQAPSHDDVPELISNLSSFEFNKRKEAKRLIRVLYSGRIAADYKPDAVISPPEAHRYLGFARQLFHQLGVKRDNYDQE